MTPFSLCNLFHALALLSFCVSFSQSLCHGGERTSLLQFKRGFRISESASVDPRAYPKVASWASNATTVDCCEWDGVECDGDTGHVVGLDLSSSFLHGSIGSNSSLVRLVHLKTLNLADNDFTHSRIPFSIKQLRRLTYLNLSDDGFSGQVPHEISELSRLSVLDLSSTKKQGLLEIRKPNLKRLIQNMTKLEVLSLGFANISSVFPTFLANFSSMVSLNLRNCGLRGDFPAGILQLLRLRNLNLCFNSLTGELPPFNKSSSLTVLNFAYNDISGELPESIGELKSLVKLEGNKCNLSGKFPQSIGKIAQLKVLSFYHNNFLGPIPSSLGNLTQLRFLDFSGNSFSNLPTDSLSKLKSLETLVLWNSQLSGTMDFDVFLTLKRLNVLIMPNNNLTLLIKPSLNRTLAQFATLDVSHCTLSGFPEFLKNQTRMEFLSIKNTGIGGPIPQWLMNTSTGTLFNLNLAMNAFTGVLSHDICNFKALKFLLLSENKLSGKLHPCLGNLIESLRVLILHGNSFSGSIPEFRESNQLNIIDLSENQLEGKLPRSLQNCNLLGYLALGNNQLDDIFPHWLGTIPDLQILMLRSNRLHGIIEVPQTKLSFPQLRIIDISENFFCGKLPSKYIKNWKAMELRSDEEFRYMSASDYDYALPSFNTNSITSIRYPFDATITLKGLRRRYEQINADLALIDFSSNNFDGEIPEVIGDLKGLHVVDLSNNKFSGSIPSSFGDLPELESLDLSRNTLSGLIPEELAKLNFLQYINVSHNFLEGPIPQANQLNRFDAASYEGNSGLCGIPLPSKCTSPDPGSSIKVEQGGSFGFGWEVVAIGYACGFVVGILIENIAFAGRLYRSLSLHLCVRK